MTRYDLENSTPANCVSLACGFKRKWCFTTILLVFSSLIILTFADSVTAVERPALLAKSQALRLGLEVEWTSHVAIDSARGTVSEIAQQIGPKTEWYSFEVKFDNNLDVFSERDRDRYGNILGIEGAKTKAEKYQKNMQDLGFEATLERKSHEIPPQVYLYALTSNGKVHCINGQTGETLWTRQHGRRDTPVWMQADRGYVSLVNGTHVYCLDGYTGELLWEKSARGVPASRPAISREYIFVPMVNGLIEDFNIRNSRIYPESVRSPGHIYVGAMATDDTISWVTDRSHLNVAFANRTVTGRGIKFRLRMESEVVAPPTSIEVHREGEPTYCNILTANLDGYVHCVDERNGGIRWVFPTGGSVRNSPLAFGSDVYVSTTERLLFSVDAGSGLEVWRTDGIKAVIGASEKKLYCIDSSDNLAILDRNSGNLLTSFPLDTTGFYLQNLKTDRIFLGSKHGAIQCLHEIGQDQPIFHRAINQAEIVKETPKRKRPDASDNKKPESIDPFGAGVGGDPEDPFGGPAMGDADDPFGGPAVEMSDDDDPFK